MNPLPWPLKAYRYGLYALEPAMAGLLAWRRRRGKEDPTRLPERRGLAGLARPDGSLVWMHGASVGETLALLGLAERIVARGATVLMTSGTVTSAEILARRLPAGALHQYAPLDAPRYVARFLAHWRPDLAIAAESEIWPNTLIALERAGVPLALVNARMSARSAARWTRSGAIAPALFSRIALCIAQSAEDAARFGALGAPRVTVAGNLKLDAPPPPADPREVAYLAGLLTGRRVLLAASTHPGEEEAVIAAHRALAPRLPGLLTVVVPRHPGRGGDVAALAAAAGLGTARRSDGALPRGDLDIYVADTLGELGLFYRLAPVAFVGGSLARKGGQNPVEAARLGAAILHGPHVANFTQAYAALGRSGGARAVTDTASLAEAAHALLDEPARARDMVRAAEGALADLVGGLDRTLAALDPYLPRVSRTGRA